MNLDLEFNYEEALKRQQHTQNDVDSLRKCIQKFEYVPKSITNKQVSYLVIKQIEKKKC